MSTSSNHTSNNTKINPFYSVLLPTFNERQNLPIITYLLYKHLEPVTNGRWEVVVVDDNSPDGTEQVAWELQRIFGNEHIQVKSRKQKLGLGSAYRFAMKYARGDFIIIMDADLSHHPEAIVQMINTQKITNCDIVSGTRYAKKGAVYGWDLKRKLTSRGANFIAHTLLGVPVSDLTGSFRLYKSSVIQALLPQIVSKGYAFQMEIICRAWLSRWADIVKKSDHNTAYADENRSDTDPIKIEEVGINFCDRVYGQSKLGTGEIIGFIKGLLELVWRL